MICWIFFCFRYRFAMARLPTASFLLKYVGQISQHKSHRQQTLFSLDSKLMPLPRSAAGFHCITLPRKMVSYSIIIKLLLHQNTLFVWRHLYFYFCLFIILYFIIFFIIFFVYLFVFYLFILFLFIFYLLVYFIFVYLFICAFIFLF